MKQFLIFCVLLANIPFAGAQTVTPFYSFNGGPDAGTPFSGLIQASDGSFYGTFPANPDNQGVVFQLTTSGILTPICTLSNANDGVYTSAGVIQDGDSLYGIASEGGTNNQGTIYSVMPGGIFTELHSFTGGNDGGNPQGGLMLANDGNLYGMASGGGTNGYGTIFRISTSGVFTNLYSFTGGNDGAYPFANLMQASDGNLYGMTPAGGTNGVGTVFRITTNGIFTSLYSFTGTNDGGHPADTLIQANDGNLYGTTFEGGSTNDAGTVFRITTSGVLTTLYVFTEGNDGGSPRSGLVLANDGNLYGETPNAGTNNYGTVYRIMPDGTFSNLYSFTGGNEGGRPRGNLIQANDGNLYGVTISGGTNGDGAVYKVIIPPPPLNILSGGNRSILFWNGPITNYIVQSTTNLSSTNWTTVGAVQVVGIAVTNSSPNQFFRLVSP